MKPRFSGKISDRKLIEIFKQALQLKSYLGKGYKLFSAESDKRGITLRVR